MKLYKLKNRYTGECVFCRDIDDITESAGYNFIKVFKEENPNRVYLVNRDAYTILSPTRDGNKAASL